MKNVTVKTRNSQFHAFEKVAISKNQQGKLKGGDGSVLPTNIITEEVLEG